MDPNYVPDEYKVPFDVIELPSQGLLYPNKKSTVKVEYLTAFDENILTSPNLINNGKVFDVLIDRKVKDLGFDPKDLLNGDRIAILIYLRTTGLGNEYEQMIFDTNGELVKGVIDLSTLKTKKLEIMPDEKGEFDYILPKSDKKIKFRLLTSKDDEEIKKSDEAQKEKNGDISISPTLRLERCIMEIDGERDKMRISHMISKLNLLDIRKLNKYITEIEPGIDLDTEARTPGGESVACFLRLGKNFWYPEV
jgi:hypothetical protein